MYYEKVVMELLAPVGDFNKLQYALNYGADAVYFASKKFGLRSFAGNFSNEELVEAINLVHSAGKKAYITVNVMPRDKDFDEIVNSCKFLYKAKADAIIVSDLGVLASVKAAVPELEIHISTQANVVNSAAANAFYKLGAKRIVLARELTIDEIADIRKNTPKDLELEAFVHGAMCISYSGRCLLSNFFTNRDANAGACVQACRWCYELKEVNRKTSYPIAEDEHGTYILNSKDMCMIEHIALLAKAGVTCFKIEGRMKSEYYVANVVNAYRRAIDLYKKNPKHFVLPKELRNELDKSSHRGYSTGFYFGKKGEVELDSANQESTYNIVAVVLSDWENGKILVKMKNRFFSSDKLEILSPHSFGKILDIKKIEDTDGNLIEDVKLVEQNVYIYTDSDLKKYDILRKEV